MGWSDPISYLSLGLTDTNGLENTLGIGSGDPTNKDRNGLRDQAGLSGGFADQSQAGFNGLGQQGQGALQGLNAIANGQNSVSALQLHQALQQNLANQSSMAAGAAPQNQAMAARTAAIQSGRLGAGLAGQQAVAGLAERNQAQQAYGGLLQGLRGQDLQGTLGGRQGAMSGYGSALGTPQKTVGGALLGATQAAAGVGMMGGGLSGVSPVPEQGSVANGASAAGVGLNG